MRRFFVDAISANANKFLMRMKASFDYKTKKNANQYGQSLGKIKKELTELRNAHASKQDVLDYLDFLINYLEEILLIKPNQMKDVIAGRHIELIIGNQASNTAPLKPANMANINAIYEDIVRALKYTTAREILFDIYNDMGIKSCVYCNAQYVTNFRYFDSKGKEQKRGNFQADHFHDKSTWPCFASSFYNLFPTCGPCNNVKNNSEDVNFSLYTEDEYNIDPFIFSLNKTKICLSSLKQTYEDIEIEFSSADVSKQTSVIKDPARIDDINETYKGDYDGHKNKLHIDRLYNQNFKSVISKLLTRINDNDEDYQKQIENAYGYLKQKNLLNINEFIYGFIQEEDRIHEEPLTKLKQDILKQFKGKIK